MGKRTPTVRLICWNEDRAAELGAELESAGLVVEATPLDGSGLRALRRDPPDAVAIDLERLPAQGRDVGVIVRTTAGSRYTPLIFVDGADDKVARTREVLPDATYALREGLAAAVRHAIEEPVTDPVVPGSSFAGYAGTPLTKKLGIKGGSMVSLVAAPADFEATLGELPEGVSVAHETSAEANVTLWFLRSLSDLKDHITRMAEISGGGRLWICWPKKASGIITDVNQNEVRTIGLASDLVDFKICAIDSTWSGLCFTRRKK